MLVLFIYSFEGESFKTLSVKPKINDLKIDLDNEIHLYLKTDRTILFVYRYFNAMLNNGYGNGDLTVK